MNDRKCVTIMLVILMGVVSQADIVGFWNFDGNSEDVILDMSGRGNHCTDFSAKRVDEGKQGKALQFEKSYLIIPSKVHSEINQEISIAVWQFGDTNAEPRRNFTFRGGREVDTTILKIHIPWRDNAVRFAAGIKADRNDQIMRTALPEDFSGRWNHWVFTKNAAIGEMKIYHNGTLWCEGESLNYPITGITIFRVGSGPEETNCYKGLIDELVIFNHALNDYEVHKLYKDGCASYMKSSTILELSELLLNSEKLISQNKTRQAIDILEAAIKKYDVNSKSGKEDWYIGYIISDMYFLLAEAKNKKGTPVSELLPIYEKAIFSYRYGIDSLIKIYKSSGLNSFKEIFKKHQSIICRDQELLKSYSKGLEEIDDWAAFEGMCDIILKPHLRNTDIAGIIGSSFNKQGEWFGRYINYCRSHPNLTEYVFGIENALAEEYLKNNDYGKALQVYRSLLSKFNSASYKMRIEYKICECLFEAGDYTKAIETIDNFIDIYRDRNKLYVQKSYLIKARCYLQSGEILKAQDLFKKYSIEYPDAVDAPESVFFAGYCSMLTNQYEDAKNAYNIILTEYPKSKYAAKAKLYLKRVEGIEKN